MDDVLSTKKEVTIPMLLSHLRDLSQHAGITKKGMAVLADKITCNNVVEEKVDEQKYPVKYLTEFEYLLNKLSENLSSIQVSAREISITFELEDPFNIVDNEK